MEASFGKFTNNLLAMRQSLVSVDLAIACGCIAKCN